MSIGVVGSPGRGLKFLESSSWFSVGLRVSITLEGRMSAAALFADVREFARLPVAPAVLRIVHPTRLVVVVLVVLVCIELAATVLVFTKAVSKTGISYIAPLIFSHRSLAFDLCLPFPLGDALWACVAQVACFLANVASRVLHLLFLLRTIFS